MKNLGDFPTAPEPEYFRRPGGHDAARRAWVRRLLVSRTANARPSVHSGAEGNNWATTNPRPRPRALDGRISAARSGKAPTTWQKHALGVVRDAALSRTQLLVATEEPGVLRVTNAGKCQLIVNGAIVQSAVVRPGDLVEVGRQLVLVRRARPLRFKGTPAEHAFGGPDQHGLVGESCRIWELRRAVAAVGTRDGPVLILGASGTGKELIARAVHAEWKARGAFVARNAGTLPESLLDAELFGNAKGYPNPGMPDRAGLIGAAHEGSLFLDEIAELPIAAQTHLLRVLDAGEYQRLGETATRRSNFRLIAATNQPESALRADVQARFMFRIQAPDLGTATRGRDPPRPPFTWKKMASEDATVQDRLFNTAGEPRLAPSFLRGLAAHPFSNNVRELRNILWQAAVATEGSTLEWLSALPSADPAHGVSPTVPASTLQQALDANNGSIEQTWTGLRPRQPVRAHAFDQKAWRSDSEGSPKVLRFGAQ